MKTLLTNVPNYIAGSICLVFGLVYLFKSSFLKYHGQALEKKWINVEREVQILILALMRVVGGGALAIGLVIIKLQLQYDAHHQSWIPSTILIAGSLLALSSLYAMSTVTLQTKGRPPIIVILVSFLLMIVGYFLN
uniref:Uncharacterized protein n=1 Tax=Sphingobacterium sp. (strain 21) TaxID=743722 RepID=F4C6A6_SPHS2